MLPLLLLLFSATDAERARELRAAAEAALPRGDYLAAQRDALTALALDASSGDEQGQSNDYSILGQAAIYLGNYAPAIGYLEKSLAIDRRRGDFEGEAVTLYNIGNANVYLGRYQQAFERYQEAIRRLDEHKDKPWQPRRRRIALANLANLYQRLGRYQKALDLYLELRQPRDAGSPSEQARVLANLGTLYRRLGDPGKALETYREAQRHFAAERHREGEISVLKNIGIALALDLGRVPEALHAFEEARRLAAAAGSGQAASCHLYIAEAQSRLGRDEEARKGFSAARKGGPEYEWRGLYGLGRIAQRAGRSAEALRYYGEAIAKIESVRSQVGARSLKREFLADKREVYDSALELTAGRPDASPGEVFRLMEQSRGRILQDDHPRPSLADVRQGLTEDTALLEYWTGGESTVVLAVTRGGAQVVRRPPADAAAWRTSAQEMGAVLLGGIAILSDPRIHNLIVVPDGGLQAVPFEALRLPQGGGLAIERYNISYLPASAALSRPGRARRRLVWPWEPRLLALADPAGGDSPLGARWEPLPKARAEAAAVSRLIGGRSEVHSGENARKERLAGFPIVHVSAHAAADYDDPERSRIVLAGGDLFLREIYSLDFRGSDLVVLSACETEAGKLVRGEGVEGFSKAFLASGAGATVTTLWRVEDSATAEFMKQFYARLAEGKTMSEALRKAKISFLRSNSPLAEPERWAGFVLSGNGRARIPRAVGWAELLGGGAAVFGCAVLMVFAVRRARGAAAGPISRLS